MASVWKGMITFGLVSIPIRLFTGARERRVSMHQLHNVCHTRLKQPLFCPHCNRMVERSEVIKGYEYEKGEYVLIDPEEIKKITPASSTAMEILSFADASEVDPIYLESSYMAMPEPHAEKGYMLLVKALEDTKKIGIAKVTMHQREYTVFIRPRDNGLTLHTMYYANEIASVEGYGKQYDVKLKPEEIKLAQQLVETLAEPFKPEQYHDEYEARLNELIEAKKRGKSVTASPKAPAKAPVIDMMDALKRSLSAREEKQPQAQPKAVPAAAANRQRRKKVG